VTFHRRRNIQYCDISVKNLFSFHMPFLARNLLGNTDLIGIPPFPTFIFPGVRTDIIFAMPRIMRAYILSENGSERVPEPKPEPEVELKTEPDLEPVEEAQKITSATLPKMAKQFGVVTNQSTTPGTGACAEKGSN